MADINLQDDDLEQTGPTSTFNPDEDSELETEKPEADAEEENEEEEEKAESADEAEEEAAKPDWESEANPYKKRFGDSQREVNENLLPKVKGIPTLEGRIAELEAALKKEKPETYDNLTIQTELKATKQQLAEIIEKSALDDFIAENSAAKAYRVQLKNLGRAFPTKSLTDLWNENFKATAEAQKTQTETQTEKRKKSQPERGGATREPGQALIGGYTEAEFNKLPVMKRRDILVKAGVKI